MVKRTLLMLQRKNMLIRSANAKNGVGSYGLRVSLEALQAVSGKEVYDWNFEYNHASRKRSETKKECEEFTSFGGFYTKIDPRTIQLGNQSDAAKFGYSGHNGFVWCASLEEATEKAKASAIADGEERIYLVKKVGEVVNQPQVRMFD